MDISTLKTLCRFIQKKTWDNKSISILWISTYAKLMQLNNNMNQYINHIRYQGSDLQIDYEWARIIYEEIDTNIESYRVRGLRHTPLTGGQFQDAAHTRIKPYNYWQSITLHKMPSFKISDRNHLFRPISVKFVYGIPKVELDINKTKLSDLFF